MPEHVPLVAVAHGSRDPRSAATIAALVEVVRAQAPELDVRIAFLDLSAPRLADVLDAVHAEGHAEAVVVPLLLGEAYHARVDVPAAATQAMRRNPGLHVSTAAVLGPDDRLATVAWHRLCEAGLEREHGIVLAAAGSAHEPANELVRALARDWSRRQPTAAAFAAAGAPKLPDAAATLSASGARRLLVGSWFLAPGLLPDRIAGQAAEQAAATAEPLGAHPLVATVVLDRYRAAREQPLRDNLAA